MKPGEQQKKLILEIEELRHELHQQVNGNLENLRDQKVLSLSQKLDQLVNRYIKEFSNF